MNLQTAIYLILSVLGVFTIMIVLTRTFGLRTFAKMSSFDFASTIAVGSILASVIMNKDQSLMQGALVLFCIIAFQAAFSLFVRKMKWFKSFFTNKPQVIMWDGTILHEHLQKCNMDENDLRAKLREANVHQLSNVKAVILESTGDVSVLHNADDLEIEPYLLEDVGAHPMLAKK